MSITDRLEKPVSECRIRTDRFWIEPGQIKCDYCENTAVQIARGFEDNELAYSQNICQACIDQFTEWINAAIRENEAGEGIAKDMEATS